MNNRTRLIGLTLLSAACSLSAPKAAAQGTLKVFLLLGQSNMEGQAYTYDSSQTEGWNVPTMEFLLSGTAAAVNYRNNMPFKFQPYLDQSWLIPRTDVWCVHYNSGNGTVKGVLPTKSGPVLTGIQPLSPGFGVNTNLGSMIGPELAMGIRLGDATEDPVFLFKSDLGGTTLGNDWRPPAAVAARGGSVGVNYTNSINQFRLFLDALDADLANDGKLNKYHNATSYEVSGIFWFQGYNEPLSGGDGPYTAAQLLAEYQDNLVDLVHSIRAADSRIPDDVGLIVGESSDQNAELNAARIGAVAELNAEHPNSAAYFDTDNMIGTNWGDNASGNPFTTDWGFHYNVRAENYLEIGWRASEAVLNNGFLASGTLWFEVPVLSGLTPNQATATVNLNDDADDVIVVWDTSDKGTASTGDWAHQQSLGAATAGQLQQIMTGLTEGTHYVVRFHAISSALASTTWSPPTPFTTSWLNPPPLLTVPASSEFTSQGATVECQLLQGDANVTLVWAYADQGDSTVSAWLAAPGGGSHNIGATTVGTLVNHSITGLDSTTGYVYRFIATNPYGEAWTGADSFNTLNPGIGSVDSLVAYWNFDVYNEAGNPSGTPQGNHEGWFEDVTGNGNFAFAADVSSGNYAPVGPGKVGNAFYSKSPLNDAVKGSMAVVRHSHFLNFSGKDFTVSFWEKSAYRQLSGSGSGTGKSMFFMKAPSMTGVSGIKGFGLCLDGKVLRVYGNDSDNFGQETLGGAAYTFPNPAPAAAFDSNQWAHWAMTAEYNATTDNYTIRVYLNGNLIDWDGGSVGTSFTVSSSTIINDGDLTIGSFWRAGGWSPQRIISNGMTPDSTTIPGEAWIDDYAIWDVALNGTEISDLASGAKNPLDITPGDTPLSIGPVGINSVAINQADVRCTINKATDGVTLYWGTTDQGETTVGWNGGSMSLGSQAAGIVSGAIPSLNENTTYYFRFFGSITSPAEQDWSPAGSFTTLMQNPPPRLETTSVTATNNVGADVQCILLDADANSTWVVWDTSDKGTQAAPPGTWANSSNLGTALKDGTLSKAISGATGDTTYVFRFYAGNAGGADWSELGTFNTGLGNEVAPTGLAVQAVNGAQVTLSWHDDYDTESGFVLRRANDAGFTINLKTFNIPAGVTSYTDSSGNSGTDYYYQIAAKNAGGTTPFSSHVMATTGTVSGPVPILHWSLDEANGDYSSIASGYTEKIRSSTVTVETPSGGAGLTEGVAGLAPDGGTSVRFRSLEARNDPDPDSILAGSIDTSGVHASGQAQIGSAMNLGRNYTITAWIKPQIVTDTIGRTIFGGGEWNNFYNVLDQQGANLRIWSGDRVVSLSNVLALNQTVFVAGLVNSTAVPDRPAGTVMTIAVYNPSTNTWSYADGTGAPKMDMKLWNMKFGNKFIGDIDDVRVYNAALSQAELNAVAVGGGGGGYSNWADTNLGGEEITEDHNGDGVLNGIAYFMNDTGVITLPGVVDGGVTWTNGGNILASAYGSEFVIMTSPDLDVWTPVDVDDLDENTDGPGGSLSYTLPTGAGRIFVRLAVSPN